MLFQEYEKGSLAGIFLEPSDKDVDKMLTKAKRLAILQTFMALLAIFIQYVEYDEFYSANLVRILDENGVIIDIKSHNNIEPAFCTLLRILMIITNGLSVFVAYKRMQADLNYKKVKRVVPFREGLFSDRARARWCIIEFLYLMIFIPPNLNKTFNLQEQKTNILITLDMIITFIVLTRVIYVLKTYVYVTQWNSWKTMQICRKYLVYQDEKFAGKAQLKGNAYLSIGVLISIIMGYLGLSLRIPERANMHHSSIDWDYIWNPIWNIIIIMTSVGYGDLYPSTGLGRVFAFGAAMIGSFIISLMVLAMSHSMSFTREEQKAFLKIKDNIFYKELTVEAARTLQKLFKLNLYLKRDGNNKRNLLDKAFNSQNSLSSFLGGGSNSPIYKPVSVRNSIQNNLAGIKTSAFDTGKKVLSFRRNSARDSLSKKFTGALNKDKSRHSIAFGINTIGPALDIIPEIGSPQKIFSPQTPRKSTKNTPLTANYGEFTFDTNEIPFLKENSPTPTIPMELVRQSIIKAKPGESSTKSKSEKHEVIKALRRESSSRNSITQLQPLINNLNSENGVIKLKDVKSAEKEMSDQFIDLRVQLIRFRNKRRAATGQILAANLDLLVSNYDQKYRNLIMELRKNSEVIRRIRNKFGELSKKLELSQNISHVADERNLKILESLKKSDFGISNNQNNPLYNSLKNILNTYWSRANELIERSNSVKIKQEHSISGDTSLKRQSGESPGEFVEPNLKNISKRTKFVDSSSDSWSSSDVLYQKREFQNSVFSPMNSKKLSVNSMDGDFYLVNYIPDGSASPNNRFNPLNRVSQKSSVDFGDHQTGYLLLNLSIDKTKMFASKKLAENLNMCEEDHEDDGN